MLWRSEKAFRFGRALARGFRLRRYLPNGFIDILAAKLRPSEGVQKHSLRRLKPWPRHAAIRSFPFESDFFSVTCHEILVDGKAIRYVDSTQTAYGRLTSLFEAEPSVMPWLESFGPGETLVDIRAGIGIHAIYAAVFTGCRVYAFEPESFNYAELNKNIFVNHLHDRVSAFCMALTNEVKIGLLDLDAGGRQQKLRQACVLSTLDTLVETGTIQAPNHIRIDVPGPDYEALAGCRRTLENSALQTVLLEIDFQSVHSHSVLDMMAALGWSYSVDQLRVNPNFILPPELIHTLRREKRDRMKYVFFRDDKYARLFRDYLAGYEPPCPFPKKKIAALIREGRTS